MVILTEQMVETKSKVSDIHRVISLNACGIDLHDISILQRMPRIEVLVLSVNKIRSLESLQNCLRLKEVYLRRNEIPSFDQLKHLRNAQGLRSLSMGENPCSEAAGANYRACVLRMLPQVTKLDDVEVCESEQTAAFQSMPYPAPKSKIRAPIPRSVTNPKGTAARASGENFDRERMQGECRPRATAGQNPLAPFEECSAEDEILLSVPSPREQRRFASARALPDCLREHSQDVIPAVNQESTRFENHSGHWLPSEFADPLPLSCPAVSPVPSFIGMNSRPSIGSPCRVLGLKPQLPTQVRSFSPSRGWEPSNRLSVARARHRMSPQTTCWPLAEPKLSLAHPGPHLWVCVACAPIPIFYRRPCA
ncbi:cilia- and flagella-associated protein 410 [Drosophila obscura]|uniref:cilia- and flagella-associated protein 410 n=1 Tax=Drosophila obscura TaxID=7282 RepID=UPI001BB219CD|nr:cilia- and flagella-associated protein 410 [Drosophila obscura]